MQYWSQKESELTTEITPFKRTVCTFLVTFSTELPTPLFSTTITGWPKKVALRLNQHTDATVEGKTDHTEDTQPQEFTIMFLEFLRFKIRLQQFYAAVKYSWQISCLMVPIICNSSADLCYSCVKHYVILVLFHHCYLKLLCINTLKHCSPHVNYVVTLS